MNSSSTGLEVALIGAACRFPGAAGIDAFWENLRSGTESIRRFSESELVAAGVSDKTLTDPAYIAASGFLDDVDRFDAEFFGISAREAELMDPQHRIFMECVWAALEDAGYNPYTYTGRIGCFGGVGMSLYSGARMTTYFQHCLLPNEELLDSLEPSQAIIANHSGYLCTRTSYKLRLTGPSVSLHTACSTGLVAVHLAIQSLLAGECDIAVAGAAALHVPVCSGYRYTEGGMFSKDGHCRPFDSEASGTVGGNGVGVVVLRRLADALERRDAMRAVVRSSAINNDGNAKVSYVAPSVSGQADVIRSALLLAQITPDTIGYVEAHGTGTALGDPIEVAALTQAWREFTERTGYCAIGSVKSNIGHLDTAAGIAGLIKAVLCLQHEQIVPTVHFQQSNPSIEFGASPFYVARTLTSWRSGATPRRAAVSALGAGGTNAHAILEEAPSTPAEPIQYERPRHLLTVSANRVAGVQQRVADLVNHLARYPTLSAPDVCFTCNVGRVHLPYRMAVQGADLAELREQLERLGRYVPQRTSPEQVRGRIAFMFTGQGAQRAGMAAGLYDTQKTFRVAIDKFLELAKSRGGPPQLRDVLLRRDLASDFILDTALAQPAIFILELALSELWLSWGLSPSGVVGHSLGEFVAAVVAGVITAEEGLELVIRRGALMARVHGGAMLAVTTSAQQVDSYLQMRPGVEVAAINGPEAIVVSGPTSAIAQLERELTCAGVRSRLLRVKQAFHSSLMEPVLSEFSRLVRRVRFNPPRIPFALNVSGRIESCVGPDHWIEHVRRPVQFGRGVEALWADGFRHFVEIGPRPTLVGVAPTNVADSENGLWLATLQDGDSWQGQLTALCALYCAGHDVDWEKFDRNYPRHRVSLPTYPFERRRFWLDPPVRHHKDASEVPPLARPRPIATGTKEPCSKHDVTQSNGPRICFEPQWVPAPANAETRTTRGPWLILGEDGELTAALRSAEPAPDIVVVPYGCWTELEQALTSGTSWGLIINLWPLRARVSELSLDRELWAGIASCLSLVQRLAEMGVSAPRLLSATMAAFDSGPTSAVPSEVSAALLAAPIWSLAASARTEHPMLQWKCVDFELGQSPSECSALLLAESCLFDYEEIAYRRGERLTRQLVPIEGMFQQPWAASTDACYLVTGGFGSLGLLVAERLAESGARHLTLFGRSEPSDNAYRVITKLRERGVEICTAQVDVADRGALDAAVAEFCTRRIDGVVHAAGELADGLLVTQTWEQYQLVMRAKVIGAWNLHLATLRQPPRFFVCFSSLASLLGSPGQANYAVANGFLDRLMRLRRDCGLHGLAVNWGPWSEVGMASRLTSNQRLHHRLVPLRPDVALDQFVALLNLPSHAAAVFNVPEHPEATGILVDLARLVWAIDVPLANTSHHALLAGVTPADRCGRIELEIQNALRQVTGSTIQVDDRNTEFHALGVDSLMGLQLRNLLVKRFEMPIPATDLFKYPTVAELARDINRRLAPGPSVSAAGATTHDMDELDGLGEDQLAFLLADELGKGAAQ